MKDKKTLITIIVLLVIFLPLSVYGIYVHATTEEEVIDDNPNREYILNNKVYFYDNDTFLGTYECSNECKVIETTIDDIEYHTHYYSLGNVATPTILDSGYALFNEGGYIKLYNLATSSVLLQFDAIKNYNVNHTEDVAIVKSNGKYGVLLTNSMMAIIPYKYDYIAIPNRVTDDVLDTSKFIAKSGSYWYVLDNNEEYSHEPFREEIVDFNDKYIVTLSVGQYNIYDYQRNVYLSNYNFKDVYCLGDYVLTIDNSNNLNIYSDLNSISIKTVTLPSYNDITFDLHANKIDVYIDGNNNQSIELI